MRIRGQSKHSDVHTMQVAQELFEFSLGVAAGQLPLQYLDLVNQRSEFLDTTGREKYTLAAPIAR